MAFVLIHHVEERLPANRFANVSPMPVLEVLHGVAVRPNHVYVAPEGKRITFRNGALRFTDPLEGASHPIDAFCIALASERKGHCIGVLLSGAGSDGTVGLQSIRAAGGLTFAQDPHSAKIAAMPQHAISAGAVDLVMWPRRIAAELARMSRNPAAPGRSVGREHLRSFIESVQGEMRAVSEELLTSIEELQNTNEELICVSEELRLANGQMGLLNLELERRNSELQDVSGELNNILASARVPILLLDASRRIRRYTPAAGELFSLASSDIGRPFREVQCNFGVSDWEPLLAEVADTLKPVEQEVCDRNGRWYVLQLRVFETADSRFSGVLLTFLDIDPVRKRLEQLLQSRQHAFCIVESMRESLLVLDDQLVVQMANRAWYETFRLTPEETLGQPLFKIDAGKWDMPSLRKHLEGVLSNGGSFDDFALEHEFPAIGCSRRLRASVQPMSKTGNGADLILLRIG